MRSTLAALTAALAVLLIVPPPVSGQAAPAWRWPVPGPVITPYRNGSDPYAGGQHRGIDIGAPAGAPVVAAAGGTVLFAGPAGSSGLTVSVRTGEGLDTSYLHLSSVAVAEGRRVDAGARLGAVGTTGRRSAEPPHLHFGVRESGSRHAYRDPLSLLGAPAPEPPPGGGPHGPPTGSPAAPVTAPTPVLAAPGAPSAGHAPEGGRMPSGAGSPAPPPARLPAGRIAPARPGARAPEHIRAPRAAVPGEAPAPAREPSPQEQGSVQTSTRPAGSAGPAGAPRPAGASRSGAGERAPTRHGRVAPGLSAPGKEGAIEPSDRLAGADPAPNRPGAGSPNGDGPDLGLAAACLGLLLAAAVFALGGSRRGGRGSTAAPATPRDRRRGAAARTLARLRAALAGLARPLATRR